jgi:hypothetical protein
MQRAGPRVTRHVTAQAVVALHSAATPGATHDPRAENTGATVTQRSLQTGAETREES